MLLEATIIVVVVLVGHVCIKKNFIWGYLGFNTHIHFCFRRNFINFEETHSMASIILLVAFIQYWIHEVFLYTKIFSGPQQFVIQMIFNNIMPDLYLTLYIPCMWIRASTLANWSGWGRKDTKLLKFQYVRRPDPREELKNKGYFKTKNRFLYNQKETHTADGFIKKRLDNIRDFSIYLICEPYLGKEVAQSTKELKTRITKQFTMNDQTYCLDIPSSCSSSTDYPKKNQSCQKLSTNDKNEVDNNALVTIGHSIAFDQKVKQNVTYHSEKRKRRKEGRIGMFGVN